MLGRDEVDLRTVNAMRKVFIVLVKDFGRDWLWSAMCSKAELLRRSIADEPARSPVPIMIAVLYGKEEPTIVSRSALWLMIEYVLIV